MQLKIFSIIILLYLSNLLVAQKGPVGIKHKTYSKETPFIYIKGYKNYYFEEIESFLNSKDSVSNELRFNLAYSAFYTSEVMFQHHGLWDSTLKRTKKEAPILIWFNKKLLEDDDELYTVAAFGFESQEEIYTSLVILNEKGEDCLKDTHPQKERLIRHFSKGIQELKKAKKFYRKYWPMRMQKSYRQVKKEWRQYRK